LVEATQPTIYLYLLLFRIRCKKTAETQRTRREKEERRKRDINKLLFLKGLQQFCFLNMVEKKKLEAKRRKSCYL